ncbi:preprotein translocase subunit SecG [Mycoplasma sp. M5725]|uniref:Protein-export membrane protein SecG n=1 Tax=Mycoplasma phocimorsus TaxID=3045839 RepID=A0AAJ1PR64_9MOLU|nr:preprotein translocase subunit SecG [Mycoplasma phocimorsus]MDJ1645827.1 preprotein translocase subunit SecG [Mycoplasma phocimorsus]MDJ1646442.1 preprotein translocase subunit SecG [Mycoplasma phocimorsus]MDJ1646994.1 preprotein translocase subunit SecG [Mycoplasma phocimorsus]MDJ1647442.1 preprotein translocase subunit SecG [Mycoplasma phocimorsus]MDJ1648026.1 preprotein translocase subunit SecG [Mycoplasma phocimorsus]
MAIAFISFLIILSIFILIISLIMSPDSNAFSGALVGSGDLELFKFSKERGFKKWIKWSMFAFGILLFILTLSLRIITK